MLFDAAFVANAPRQMLSSGLPWRRRWALLVAVMALAPACNCPGTPTNDLPDGGADAGQACEPVELVVGDVVLDAQQDVQTIYSAPLETELGGAVGDFLVFNFVNYNERFGPLAVGTFSLAEAPNDNRATCPECLSVFEDQLTPSSRPEAVFFQSGGTITLDVDPRSGVLSGVVEDLMLVEVTVDDGTLESTPVPGGRCLSVERLELDYRFVPAAWTCDAALYNNGGLCNCDCGAPDPDCSCDPFANPDCPDVIENDCAEGAACTVNGCVATCDPFTSPGTPCGAGELCVFDGAAGGPVCVDASGRVNTAALGETCQGLGNLVEYCDVTNTLPAGVCDDISGTCLPICGPAPDDCGEGESCYTIAGGGPGDGWGFCVSSENAWVCDPDSYDDGALCDCNCGAPDPDCENSSLDVLGCAEGERCVEDSCTSP